jgi:hypothetical protein
VRRQTRDQKLYLTIARALGLQLEEEPLLIGGPLDRLFFGEPRACQFEIDLLPGGSQVQTPAYSIAGDNLQNRFLRVHLATEAEAPKNRVVRNDG